MRIDERGVMDLKTRFHMTCFGDVRGANNKETSVNLS